MWSFPRGYHSHGSVMGYETCLLLSEVSKAGGITAALRVNRTALSGWLGTVWKMEPKGWHTCVFWHTPPSTWNLKMMVFNRNLLPYISDMGWQTCGFFCIYQILYWSGSYCCWPKWLPIPAKSWHDRCEEDTAFRSDHQIKVYIIMQFHTFIYISYIFHFC